MRYHTIAIRQSLLAHYTEHIGLAVPPVSLPCTLMRKPKTQVEKYLGALRARAGTPRARRPEPRPVAV